MGVLVCAYAPKNMKSFFEILWYVKGCVLFYCLQLFEELAHICYIVHLYKTVRPADLQVCGVFRDVWRYSGQLEIGAVNHCAFTATLLWTYQVLETFPTQTAAIVLLTCRSEFGVKKKKKNVTRNNNEEEDRRKNS